MNENKVEDKNNSVAVKNTSSTAKIKVDLNKIVAGAQKMYGKGEAGLAKQITTGTKLRRPTTTSDCIRWTKGNHWKSLTGLDGLNFGFIYQFSGKPDSGKSTHAMLFMVEAQKQDVVCILWNAEKKFSVERFEKMGGNPGDLLVVETNNIVEGAKQIAFLVDSIKENYPNAKIMILWDSVGSSIPPNDDQEDSEDLSKQPGQKAKYTAWCIEKLQKLMFRHQNKETGDDSILVCVCNQIYQNIGSPGYTEKGGQQLYYLSSLILQLSRKSDLTRTRKGVKYKHGIVTRAKVKKNHLFDGNDCIAELELEVSAANVRLFGEKDKDEDGEILIDDNDE